MKKSIVALAIATLVIGMSLSAAPSFAQGSESSSSASTAAKKHHHHAKHKKSTSSSSSSSG